MKLKERIALLCQLGEHFLKKDDYLEAVMHRTYANNHWFTVENQKEAVRAIAESFLQKEKLEAWLENYAVAANAHPSTVGLVLAGNIPLVGFHDLLCVFVAGHKSQIKLSEKDKYLLPYLLKLLTQFNPAAANYFETVGKLQNFDAVIATGSNNSARYFESYFGKYPHVIRKNRTAVAVLEGTEDAAELFALGKDIFQYFGLGCRNVSKIYVPEGYVFKELLEVLHEYKELVLHEKYKNNFDYNYALYMLNRMPFLNNGCLLITENASLHSRIAALHFEYFSDKNDLEIDLHRIRQEIQCVVAKSGLLNLKTLPFGKAQQPELWDYADGVDTMDFLLNSVNI